MSSSAVKAAFEKLIVVLPIDIIVPQKEITKSHRSGDFYRQLTASLKHVGLIEPLVVYPRGPRDYLLLEGHMRLEILKSMGSERPNVCCQRMMKPIPTIGMSTTYPPSHSISCCLKP